MDDAPSPPVALRRPVVGVMGSGRDETPHEDLAAPLGRWLAREGYHLLTGGGGGVMAATARAFCSVSPRSGLSIGILPRAQGAGGPEPPPGYPNPWVELAIRTHLDGRGAAGEGVGSRNHINVLTPDVIVALPGGPGTESEIALAAGYHRPLVLWHGPRATTPTSQTSPLAPDLETVLELIRRHAPAPPGAPG